MRMAGHTPAAESFRTYSKSGSDAALIEVSRVVTKSYGKGFAAALDALVEATGADFNGPVRNFVCEA